MDYPKIVKIENEVYTINTNFRIGIECDKVAQDDEIDDEERALAIIYLLFGEKGLKTKKHHEKLLNYAKFYLNCGKEISNKERKEEKIDMDFIQDYDYIEASFLYDYKLDLENSDMHWWKFIKLINGLSNNEDGNCCVLNRVRNLRNFDISKVKDAKERQKIIEAQKSVALKKKNKKLTEEQKTAIDEFNKLAKIERK